jgi:BirA family biotin operon repressor/biotin-[acetyl-CoA-carboxylase] ligase
VSDRPTALDPEAFSAALSTQRFGRTFAFLDTCGSTNDELARRARDGAPEGSLLATEHQTEGRGRRGRGWHSPAGENLYVSLLLRPALPALRVSPVSLLLGAAMARALRALGFAPVLKWPNDVLLQTSAGRRKVAGILAEMSSEAGRVRHVIVGFGVNVNGRAFPDELRQRATSLALTGGHPLDRALVLATIVNAFEPIYDDFLVAGPGAGIAEWRQHAMLGQRCFVEREGARLEGTAEDVDDGGALLLRTSDGNAVAIHAGEVHWQDGAGY